MSVPHLQARSNQGRRTSGYCLRRSLEDQGVTSEKAMKAHLDLIYQTLEINPRFDVTRYRVNSNNPNSLAMG